MSAADLLARARAAGVSLTRAPGGRLDLACSTAPPADLVAAIKEGKAEILRELASERRIEPGAWLVEFDDSTWSWDAALIRDINHGDGRACVFRAPLLPDDADHLDPTIGNLGRWVASAAATARRLDDNPGLLRDLALLTALALRRLEDDEEREPTVGLFDHASAIEREAEWWLASEPVLPRVPDVYALAERQAIQDVERVAAAEREMTL